MAPSHSGLHPLTRRYGSERRAPRGPRLSAARDSLDDGEPALASCSPCPMIELDVAYQQIARPWSHAQLAAHYQEADRRGGQVIGPDHDDTSSSPIALLASSIPRSTSLSVAVHVLHVLPSATSGQLAPRFVDTIKDNAAAVLHLSQRALELDGQAHGYTADEWLAAVYDIAMPLLTEARLDREPPSIVDNVQDAVRWLAHAIINLDRDTPAVPAAIADGLGPLLALCVFADVAHGHVDAVDH